MLMLMSAVETGQMSAAETGQMSAVETRQISTIETGLFLQSEISSLQCLMKYIIPALIHVVVVLRQC